MKYLKKFRLFENQISAEVLMPPHIFKGTSINRNKFYSELQKSIEGKSADEAKQIAYGLYGKFLVDAYKVRSDKRYHMSTSEIKGQETNGKIKPDNIEVKKQPNNWRKPLGIWYGFGDSWINFSLNEMGDDTKFSFQPYHYEVHLKNGANILKLFNKKQVDDFIEKYKSKVAIPEHMNGMNGKGIDWERVANDHQGIEFPRYTETNMRQWWQSYNDLKYEWLYSVDVNSGCVWDPNAIDYMINVSDEIVSLYKDNY